MVGRQLTHDRPRVVLPGRLPSSSSKAEPSSGQVPKTTSPASAITVGIPFESDGIRTRQPGMTARWRSRNPTISGRDGSSERIIAGAGRERGHHEELVDAVV